jgi:hypothetical protein
MLHDGDVILAIDKSENQPRVEVNSADDLITAVKAVVPGQTITLEVLRRGRVIKVALTLDRKPMNIDTAGAIEEFTNRRIERADAMWQKEFAQLLDDSVG